MDIAAASTVIATNSVKGELSVGLLKKALDQNQDIASQLITKVLEGSLDPNLGKHLNLKI